MASMYADSHWQPKPRGVVDGWAGVTRAPLASEIQEMFRNFKTLYQLRMYVMTSWDLNVNVRRKNIKLSPPPLSPYPRCPCHSPFRIGMKHDLNCKFLDV